MKYEITGQMTVATGCVINAIVQLCADEKDKLKQLNRSIPIEQTLKALIDTGASISVVDLGILNSMSATQVGSASIYELSGGYKQRPTFNVEVALLFPSPTLMNLSLGCNTTCGVDLSTSNIKMVLGRDLLKHFTFSCDGQKEVFSISCNFG
jgi:hypothetical protein